MNIDELYQDLLALPDPIQEQVRDFVGYLKHKYSIENSSSSLQSPLKTGIPSSPELASTKEAFTEDTFWGFIEMLDYNKREPTGITAPLVSKLSAMGDEIIFAFQDILALKLSQLDDPAYFEAAPGSSDSFLYARCCVVANGKAFFNQVLNDPKKFSNDPSFTFEALLYVADNAYKLKHGKDLDRLPAYNYESFFNEKAWGDKAIRL